MVSLLRDDAAYIFCIGESDLLLTEDEHFQKTLRHFVFGVSRPPEELPVCGKSQRLSGIQFAVHGNVQTFTDKNIRQFSTGFIGADEDSHGEGLAAFAAERIQFFDQVCHGTGFDIKIFLLHLKHHGAPGLSGGGGRGGMCLELHFFESHGEKAVLISKGETVGLEDPVDGVDDGDRGAEGAFQCTQEISISAIRCKAVFPADHTEKFRVPLPPLVDGLLDIAHEKERAIPVAGIVVDRFVRQVFKDLPLPVGGILKLIQHVMIGLCIDPFFQRYQIGAGESGGRIAADEARDVVEGQDSCVPCGGCV